MSGPGLRKKVFVWGLRPLFGQLPNDKLNQNSTMKKTCSHLSSGRAAIGALFLICGFGLLCTTAVVDVFATPTPSTGTVGPSPGGPSATWQQGSPPIVGGNVNMESSCVENVSCETFTVTVSGTQSSWVGQRVQVQLNWQSSGNEYDIYIHQGANTNNSGTGANSGPLVTSAINGPGLTNQTAFIDVAQWGTGVFTVHVVEDVTPVATDSYTGTATAVP